MVDKGPDILSWAQDTVGDLVESGLISELPLPPDVVKNFVPAALEAFRYKQRYFGLPYGFETLSIICNKKLFRGNLSSYNDILQLARSMRAKGKYGLVFINTDFYFAFPVYSIFEPSVFRSSNGIVDFSTVRINTAEGLAGLNAVAVFRKESLLPKGLDYQIMEKLFLDGEAACMVTGPWALGGLRAAKIDYKVVPFPMTQKPMRTFLGAQGFMVSSSSKNTDLANEFVINYLASSQAISEIFDTERRLPARSDVFEKKRADNPDLLPFFENSKNALTMYNAPAMSTVWAVYKKALGIIDNGQGESLKDIAATAEQAFQNMKIKE